MGNLEAAENKPEMVGPHASLREALTIMDLRDYSQLAVGTGYGSVKGIVSYKSIARAQLHGDPREVRHALDVSVPRVEPRNALLDVVALFQKHDAVLVQGPDRVVRGIVTPADIAEEFSALAGPFLLIGQIEEQLRWLIKRWLERDKVDLAAALKLEPDGTGEATPKEITDLTMGELLWILSAEDNWRAVGIKYDRVTCCAEFDEVRQIRNAVMPSKRSRGPRSTSAFKISQRWFSAHISRRSGNPRGQSRAARACGQGYFASVRPSRGRARSESVESTCRGRGVLGASGT